MSAQEVMLGARLTHVRELQTQVSRLQAENARLRDDQTSLRAHFAQALLAAQDLRQLPEGGRMEIWDGWNLILGSPKAARDRGDLLAQAKRAVAAEPSLRVWIVLDGAHENSSVEGAVRTTYTGGTGGQRADRYICDYLRMARILELADRVSVRTNDREFMKTVKRIKGER